MFNKLKQQLTGAANKKKTESPNLIEDVEIKVRFYYPINMQHILLGI